MKRSGSALRIFFILFFFALAGLMAIATLGAVQSAGYVYLPPAVEVTGLEVERAENGGWVTLELQNLSSSAARVDSSDFFFYADDNEWLDVIESSSLEYSNPFYSGWEPQLPGGRSGSVRFFLPLPQDASELRVEWFLDDELHQMTAVLDGTPLDISP